MNPHIVALLVFACVFGAVLLGMRLRAALPEHHLSDETKDAVRIGMGLVATMAALILKSTALFSLRVYASKLAGYVYALNK